MRHPYQTLTFLEKTAVVSSSTVVFLQFLLSPMSEYSRLSTITDLANFLFKDDCRFCHPAPSKLSSSNSSNRLKHLRNKHGEQFEKCRQEWVAQSRAARQAEERRGKRRQSLPPSEGRELTTQEFHEEAVKFLASNHLPMTTMECPHLKRMLTHDPYTANTYMAHTVQLSSTVQDRIQASLQEASSIAITSDGWTRASRHFVTKTAHWVQGSALLKAVLDTTEVVGDEGLDAPILTDTMKATLAKYNIAEKINVMVTDGASVMKSMHRQMRTYLPHCEQWEHCAAHNLHLCFWGAHKTVNGLLLENPWNDVVSKVKEVVAKVRRSCIHKAEFLELRSMFLEDDTELIASVLTRWTSTFDMLERAVSHQSSLTAFCSEDELTEPAWAVAQALVSVMTPSLSGRGSAFCQGAGWLGYASSFGPREERLSPFQA